MYKYWRNPQKRVSFRAATPEGFETRTGAIEKHYELPFKPLEYLLDNGVYAKAVSMTDFRILPAEERDNPLQKLYRLDQTTNYSHTLEEETIDPHDITAKRMEAY